MAEIAILRALKLGDLLCSVPAFRAVRRAHPHDRLTLIGLPWAERFASRFSDVLDGFLPFPGWPGMPERIARSGEVEAFLDEARGRRFARAIQVHGSGITSNQVVASLGASSTAGFTSPGAVPLDETLPYPDELHEVDRHLALLEHLGIGSAGDDLTFPVSDDDREELARSGFERGDGYAVVHAGAISGRRWSSGRFAAVAEVLRRDLRVVLTGSGPEREVTAWISAGMSSPVIDLAGRTSLGALAALLDGAALVVTNDTGVSHLAAALSTPSVVLFLSSDPRRWAPLDTTRHRAVVHPAIAAMHLLHPERRGALRERCLSDGCDRHPPVREADPDAIGVGPVIEEVGTLLAASIR